MSLDFLNSTGWDAINQATAEPAQSKEEIQAAIDAEYELAAFVASTFAEGSSGKYVLDALRKHTVDKPVIQASQGLTEQLLDMQITSEQWLWMRAGQNSVIHWIDGQIQKAIDGPPDLDFGEDEREDDGS